MQRILRLLPGADIANWLAPWGQAVSLVGSAFSGESFKNFSWNDFRNQCSSMGLKSFHLVALSAMFVAIALVIQCVIELQKYQSHDLAGAVISIGLLREIGPLTVGMAWCTRIAALVAEEAQTVLASSSRQSFATTFVLPRYFAALLMSVPLSTYGLIIGFITGAFVAPLLGVSSANQFLESAREAIENKDLITFFLKLILLDPAIGVFVGCVSAIASQNKSKSVVTNAVTASFITGAIANLIVTIIIYLC